MRAEGLEDVAGIRVGHWTDHEGMTGVTVVVCPEGTVGAGEVRGPAPGTRRFRDCRIKFKVSVSNSRPLEPLDLSVQLMHTIPTSNVHPLLRHNQYINLLESIQDKYRINGDLNNLPMHMYAPTSQPRNKSRLSPTSEKQISPCGGRTHFAHGTIDLCLQVPKQTTLVLIKAIRLLNSLD